MSYEDRNWRGRAAVRVNDDVVIGARDENSQPVTVLGYPLVNVLFQKLAKDLFYDAENFAPLHVFKGYLLLAEKIEELRKLVLTENHDAEALALRLQSIAAIASKTLLDGVIGPAVGIDPFVPTPMCACCGKAILQTQPLNYEDDDVIDFDSI